MRFITFEPRRLFSWFSPERIVISLRAAIELATTLELLSLSNSYRMSIRPFSLTRDGLVQYSLATQIQLVLRTYASESRRHSESVSFK